jgi:hypothetical protein
MKDSDEETIYRAGVERIHLSQAAKGSTYRRSAAVADAQARENLRTIDEQAAMWSKAYSGEPIKPPKPRAAPPVTPKPTLAPVASPLPAPTTPPATITATTGPAKPAKRDRITKLRAELLRLRPNSKREDIEALHVDDLAHQVIRARRQERDSKAGRTATLAPVSHNQRDRLRRPDAVAIACPACHAAADEGCHAVNPRGVHHARWDAWRAKTDATELHNGAISHRLGAA